VVISPNQLRILLSTFDGRHHLSYCKGIGIFSVLQWGFLCPTVVVYIQLSEWVAIVNQGRNSIHWPGCIWHADTYHSAILWQTGQPDSHGRRYKNFQEYRRFMSFHWSDINVWQYENPSISFHATKISIVFVGCLKLCLRKFSRDYWCFTEMSLTKCVLLPHACIDPRHDELIIITPIHIKACRQWVSSN